MISLDIFAKEKLFPNALKNLSLAGGIPTLEYIVYIYKILQKKKYFNVII